MIRSKMKELAWRHHFPIISLWEIFRWSRAANSVVSRPIWPKFELVRDFMHVLVTCKYKKGSDQKQPRNGGDIVFLIISQWGLSVAMKTRVLPNLPPLAPPQKKKKKKLMRPFPHPSDATHKLGSRLAILHQRYSS